MRKITIKFAKHQKLPEGYIVQWWESIERYVWVKDNVIESEGSIDRWEAYRGAWAHFNENLNK